MTQLALPHRPRTAAPHHVVLSRAVSAEPTVEPLVTVLLPAYNEAAALPAVLSAVLAALDSRYEVIVVDDGSSDDTAAIAARYPVRLIRHERNRGKGAAMRTGFRAARGRCVIVMDADNTYPASAIPALAALLEQHDLVRGVRQQSAANCPLVNRIGNQIFDQTLAVIYGLQGGDYLTGLYGLSRKAIQQIEITADGFDIEVEIGIKARAYDLPTTSLPISYHERLGEKKLKPFQDGWRILRRILSLALVYNPVATFILPGLALWALTLLLVLGAIGSSGAVTSEIGFGSMLSAIAGFQFLTFGVAAALYGVERGMPVRRWMLLLSDRLARARMRLFGGALVMAGVFTACSSLLSQLQDPAMSTGTGYLAAAVFLAVGAQALVASMFLSIFAGRIEKRQGRPAPADAPHSTSEAL
jgi:glycosyltransferase involved in cell wall biosynthesis